MDKSFFRAFLLTASAALLFSFDAAAVQNKLAEDPIEEITVQSKELKNYADERGMTAVLLDFNDLDVKSTIRIDEALLDVPGLSLFRRASSRTAHPTIQGVTLRNIAPSGAGRSIVLLDGVPQNDPFGGWVYWTGLSVYVPEGINVISGGSVGRWGNQALSGAVDIRTRQKPETSAEFRFGTDSTYEGRSNLTLSLSDKTSLKLFGYYYETAGDYLYDASQRGPIDIPAASDTWTAGGRLNTVIGDKTDAFLAVSRYEESRTNGLSLSTNETEAWDITAGIGREKIDTDPGWGMTAFFRNRAFVNSFAAARDNRTVERAVLDQYDVPATGIGATGYLQMNLNAHEVEIGADIRFNDGETNEQFANLGDGFTKLRIAGGAQLFGGAYLDWLLESGDTTFSAGARLDYWKTSENILQEHLLATGEIIRDDPLENRDGWIANGRLGVVHKIGYDLRLNGSLYSGFRVPTLNELYRPFRVGNDITEANPDLAPEKLYGIDIGFNWLPTDTVDVAVTYYHNEVRDGVGNVTLAHGPGFFAPTGFVPAGGTLRQRQNITRIRIDGVDVSLGLKLGEKTDLNVSYLYSNARIIDDDVALELAGKKLVQTPEHQFVIEGKWSPFRNITFWSSLRYLDDQYDDDLNSRVLDSQTVVDLSVNYYIDKNWTLSLNAQNVFDAEVITALSADGLRTLGYPRYIGFGVRYRR